MLKNSILMIVASIIVMFFHHQIGFLLRFLLDLHDHVADGLGLIFSNATAGRLIQETIALIILPVGAGALAALLFWLAKRHEMPHIIGIVWVVWVVLVVVIASQPAASPSSLKHTTFGKVYKG